MSDELAGIEEDVPFNFAGAAELERELRKLGDAIFGEDDTPDIPPPEPPARFVVEASCTGRG